MAKLPKKYIKKYGISKAAWAAYRRDTKKPRRSARPKATRRKSSKGRSVKTKSRSTSRKGGNSNMFNFGGGLGKSIMVGVGAGIVNQFIPINIAGADLIIAGMIMKDTTVQKIGAVTLGRSLSSSITGMLGGGLGGNGGTAEGGGWL